MIGIFQLPLNGNFYVLEHPNIARRSKRSADDIASRLKSDPNVSSKSFRSSVPSKKNVIKTPVLR